MTAEQILDILYKTSKHIPVITNLRKLQLTASIYTKTKMWRHRKWCKWKTYNNESETDNETGLGQHRTKTTYTEEYME